MIPAAARDSRQTLIAAANAYFDVFNDNSTGLTLNHAELAFRARKSETRTITLPRQGMEASGEKAITTELRAMRFS